MFWVFFIGYIIIKIIFINKIGGSMDFLELAKTRRSIRSYQDRAIPHSDLELCVEAARLAPSACNSQPWKFIVVEDPDTKNKISEKAFSGLYQMNSFAKKAASYIVIVAEKMKFPAWCGNKLRKTDFRRIDIGTACDHLVLQAQELGIGTCILGWFNEKEIRKILSVPRTKKIELVISMGYPSASPTHTKELKQKSDAVSFNKYSSSE
ncbi:MAG: NAD(P)H nitroreductase [Candidatus Omnitrophica bacterium]|nr:NAD(P)H nitroreductase [Candidatus Omnitrophota bacterium]